MKILIDSLNSSNIEQLVKEGKLAKVEFYASTRDGFAERCAKFLNDVGNYTACGASRTVGIIDDSELKDMKLFIDGDGADRIREVTIDGKVTVGA